MAQSVNSERRTLIHPALKTADLRLLSQTHQGDTPFSSLDLASEERRVLEAVGVRTVPTSATQLQAGRL